jgi:hypothetical protein
MKPVKIDIGNLHQSQLPDPPKDIVKQVLELYRFPSEEIAVLALKSWYVVCLANGWVPSPDREYVVAHSMLMSGFIAGYNCHTAKSMEIARSN